MIDQLDPLLKLSQRKITYSEESAIQSLIRGPNPLHSLIKGSLYCYGPLKTLPNLISAHKSLFYCIHQYTTTVKINVKRENR